MSEVKQKKRVGVIRGGEGGYYEKSLKDGGDILSCIHENLLNNWKPVDILIDKENIWHADGMPINPADLIHRVDVVWNTSHPSYSQVVESLKIPYFGIDSFSYALSENKNILRDHMKIINVAMPRHLIFPVYQEDFDGQRERFSIKKAKEVHEKFSPPWIVKSLDKDPNIGIHLAQNFPELVDAIEDIMNHRKSILIEEFIIGKEVNVHMLSGFRSNKEKQIEKVYIFPFGKFSDSEKEKINSLSREIFRHMGVSNYLKSDFKIHPSGKIYFTGTEHSMSFDKNSNFSLVSESIGVKQHHIIEHILNKFLS